MKKSKLIKVLEGFFCFHPALALLISIPSFALVIYTLITPSVPHVITYFSYVFSAYGLTLFCVCIYRYIFVFTQKIKKNKHYKRYKTDISFKFKLSLLPGSILNSFYVATNTYTGITTGAFWFIALAVYYALLFSVRLYLLFFIKNHTLGENSVLENQRCRTVGIILMFLDLALSVIVLFMVAFGHKFSYRGAMIYAMAAYSFYSVISACVNLIKYRNHKSPIPYACKVVSLTSALVSLLSLETAMLSTFGNENDSFNTLMTALTGAGVCMAVMAMAIFMIIRQGKAYSNYARE